MELVDLLKKASDGTLQCPKCGWVGMSLQNVLVGMERGEPKVNKSAYGLCKKCGVKMSFEKLEKIIAGNERWWKFWK